MVYQQKGKVQALENKVMLHTVFHTQKALNGRWVGSISGVTYQRASASHFDSYADTFPVDIELKMVQLSFSSLFACLGAFLSL
jgi:hypothetical protein